MSYAQDASESSEKQVCRSEFVWSACLEKDKKVKDLKDENKKLEGERDAADGRTFEVERLHGKVIGELAMGNQEIGGLKAENRILQEKLDRRWHPVKIALVGAAAVVVAEAIAVVVYVVAFKKPASP